MPAVTGRRARPAPVSARRTLVFRPLTLTGGFVLSAALALAVLAGNYGIHRPAAPAAVGSTARERYDALYQAAFRSDGGRSTVTADAVFEFPALQQALAAYPQRGLVQAQILDLLTLAKANDEALAFSVTIAARGVDVADFDVPANVSLIDDQGRSYPVRTWSELAAAGDANRAGIQTFDRTVKGQSPESAGAKRLTLTVQGLEGGPRSYTWDLAVLGLSTR